MKLKVACSSCSRVHIITLVEEKVAPIMEMNCIFCGAVVKYRIAVQKKEESAEEMLRKMFDIHGKDSKNKSSFESLFGEVFGGRKP